MFPYTKMAVIPEIEAYLIANSVIVFLTVVVVALRVVSRLLAGSNLGWDDFFTLLAMPQGIAMLVLQGLCKCFQTKYVVYKREAKLPFRDNCRSWISVVRDWRQLGVRRLGELMQSIGYRGDISRSDSLT